MKGKTYSEEFKNQILQEVKEVGNVSLVGRKHGISTSTIFTWISKSKNKDKIEVANKYINAGYSISLVLKIIKLSRSTYYYNMNYKVKDEDRKKRTGRKPVGYSITKDKKKICDDEIKDFIIEAINGDAQYYGYRKITHYLRRTYNLIINFKKVYRLCKEINILRDQRKTHPKCKRILASNRTVTASNQVWEIDIKYGYVQGEDKFFYTLNVIDVFDRSIIDYHMGLHCEGKDAAALIRRCLIKRNLFMNDSDKPVIRSDNGPQFISHIFEDTCLELHIEHERIPVKTPNKNAHIESFYRILENECFKINEFQTYAEAYKIVNDFMIFYNERRLHSSLRYMSPKEFYTLYLGEHLEKISIKI